MITGFQLPAQDFLYTKQNELKEVQIQKEDGSYLRYRSGDKVLGINKSDLQGYAIKNPARKRFSDVMVITKQRDTLSGKLLYMNRDSLYLWRGEKKYIPNQSNFKAVSTADILQ